MTAQNICSSIRLLLFLLLADLLSEGPVFASQAEPGLLPVIRQQARSAGLALERQWLALGHYRETGFSGQLQSEIDDPGFFLAANGKQDPQAELDATLAAFSLPADPASSAAHPQCLYPARFRWLDRRLGLTASGLNAVACPELDAWLQTLAADSVTLVFPAAYLNSPSSMFGHTFLRIDRKSSRAPLLAWTVNYAADAQMRDNEFSYAYKGLFGGYPGILTVQPYYDKVKEYSDMEHRDIWEYRLNLQPGEIDRMLRHVWELKNRSRFDYFFLDENCAYRLLSLLEVARPEMALLGPFSIKAIPSDTVRMVAAEGLVQDATFRPSAVTVLRHEIRQLTATGRELARQLGRDDASAGWQALEDLDAQQQAAVLDVAYRYLRYRVQKEHLSRDDGSARRSLKLLRARSRISAGNGLTAPPVPPVRPDQGHATRRWQLGAGRRDERGYLSLGFRGTYHDLLDPQPGYQPGAAIRLLDTSLRLYNRGVVRLESLEVLGITSLSPGDGFFSPWSWQLSTGLKRKLFDDDRFVVGYFQGGVGLSYDVPGGFFSAMLEPRLEVSGNFRRNFAAGASLSGRYLYSAMGGQGELGLRHGGYWLGDEHVISSAWLEHVINLGKQHALSLQLLREKSRGEYDTEFNLSIETFF